MEEIAVRNPITKEPLPLIIERGEVKAVVMDIEQFKVIAELLETMEEEDIREAAQLAKLPMFRSAVEEGLEAVKEKKTRPWRETLADLGGILHGALRPMSAQIEAQVSSLTRGYAGFGPFLGTFASAGNRYSWLYP